MNIPTINNTRSCDAKTKTGVEYDFHVLHIEMFHCMCLSEAMSNPYVLSEAPCHRHQNWYGWTTYFS